MKNQSYCIQTNSDPCTAAVYVEDAKLPINTHANFSTAWVRGISNLSNMALQGTIQTCYDCFLSAKFKIYSLLNSFHSQASHCCWISAILRPCFTSTYIAQWVGHSDRGSNSYFGIRKRGNFKIWKKSCSRSTKNNTISCGTDLSAKSLHLDIVNPVQPKQTSERCCQLSRLPK